MKKVLTIAGSDSCAGAGIQADLKTFSAHLVYGMSVITSVTAQNTLGVIDSYDLPIEIIEKQIDAIFQDIEVDSVKIGMLSRISIIVSVTNRLKLYKAKNIVLDPVMISKSGFKLLKDEAVDCLIKYLLPICTLITPNIHEASLLSKIDIKCIEDMKTACKSIYDLGVGNVLIKGGHLEGEAVDILFNGKEYFEFKGERVNTKNTHGTGCTLSSAIAANLALGLDIVEAVSKSKDYIQKAIEHSFSIGKGVGPVNHFF